MRFSNTLGFGVLILSVLICGCSSEKTSPPENNSVTEPNPPTSNMTVQNEDPAAERVDTTDTKKSGTNEAPENVKAAAGRTNTQVSVPQEVKQPQASTQNETSPQPSETAKQAIESEASLERFHQLLRRKPLHRPALEGLVKHYAERGQLQVLVAEYEAKVTAIPDDESLQIVLARLYLRSGKSDRAVEILDSLKNDDDSKRQDAAQLLTFRSQVYQRVGRSREAIAMLHKALLQAKTIALKTKLNESLADLYLVIDDKEQAATTLLDFAAEYPKQYFHRKRLADALAARDLHEDAVREYRNILKMVKRETDKRCEVLRQLGRSQEKLGKQDDAVSTYTLAISLLDGGHWLQRELHQRVVSIYRASNRIEELVSYCSAQIKKSPGQTAMRELLADVLYSSGKLEEAKQTLTDAVRLFPRDRSLSRKRVELLERANDLDGISAEYERVIAEYPDDLDFYVEYGQFLARNKKLDQARNQWRHVLDGEVTDTTLANRLGSLFVQFELYDDAADCYRRAMSLDSKRPESYTALSRLLFLQGQRTKAMEVLDQMAQANPDDAAVHARLSQALSLLSFPGKALQAIARACELDPEQYRYQMAHADLLLQTGATDQALQVRRKVIDLIKNGPQQMKAIDVLVSMYDSAGKLQQLKQNEGERLKSGHHPVSLLLLARAADLERDFVSSRRYLDKLLQDDPGHEEGHKQLASLHYALGDIDASVSEYRKLIELYPARNRSYYEAIAELKLKYGDRAGVVETLEELVEQSPRNAAVLRSVAQRLLQIEEPDKALDYFQRGVALQPDNFQGRLQYAKALRSSGRLEDAYLELRRTALQGVDRNSSIDAIALLYDTAGQLGQLDLLLEELRLQVERNPDETVVAWALAMLYIREYEYSRATQLLDLVLRYHPGDINLRLVQGELYRHLTRFDDAIEEYERVLRLPYVDRNYVLGEIGKSYFESGRLDQARRTWKRISNQLYAGTLLRNNGFPADAVEIFQEGIRIQPDAFHLHRNLIQTYDSMGRSDDALNAAKRLLDLEPDKILNIKGLAEAWLKRGERAKAATVAGRLFGSGLQQTRKNPRASYSSGFQLSGMSISMVQMMSAYGYGRSSSNPLSRAIEFFSENGLLAELESILETQISRQPDNGPLKLIASEYFGTQFGKPGKSLEILKQLESASFPVQSRPWQGRCSQRDYFRLRQLGLVSTKPALRDAQLTLLEKKKDSQLSHDEQVTLAVIRLSQGNQNEAIKLFLKIVQSDAGKTDHVVNSMLVATLLTEERYRDAQPHALRLIALLETWQKKFLTELRDLVKREYVRTLPVKLQLKVDDDLLDEMVRKWSQGQVNVIDEDQNLSMQVASLFHTKITLATIYAKTNQMGKARRVWKELEPPRESDADGWATLAGLTQIHGEKNLTFAYYQRAMQAAKQLVTDPLLNRIYGSSMNFYSWFGGSSEFDSSFNKVLETFSERKKLVELYDYLRETQQASKARKIAEHYKMLDRLQELYRNRLARAREEFRKSKDDPLQKSIPYFVDVVKLAEVYEWSGDWSQAEKVYLQYLEDFPDELSLLQMFGKIAEANGDHKQALEWEKRVVAVKGRLSRRGPAWRSRSVFLVPSLPRVLAANNQNLYYWMSNWKPAFNFWGGNSDQLDRSVSWMRIAKLYLAMNNTIAAVDAMQQAIRVGGTTRSAVAKECLTISRERQLTKDMLPVFRSLIAQLQVDRDVQLAFADSLERNEKQAAAAEVYRRVLRQGVTDLEILNLVRQKLSRLDPQSETGSSLTLVKLESQTASDPENIRNLLRLGKAYYYSLDVEKAQKTLLKVRKLAPHLQELDDLLIEIYSVRNESNELIDGLRSKIKKAKSTQLRSAAQHKLVSILLKVGRTEEALKELKKTADPKNPESYIWIGQLLQYFGHHDDAIAHYELLEKSQTRSRFGYGYGIQNASRIVQALAFKGDMDAAADRLISSVAAVMKESSSQSGFGAMSMFYGNERQENSFQAFVPIFVIYPKVLEKVKKRVSAATEKDLEDLAARRMLVQLYQLLGRNDLTEALIQDPKGKNLNDQESLKRQIEEAIVRKDFQKAIELAEQWLTRQPKAKLPPGVPAQFASQLLSASVRNQMICRIGDLHWKLGHKGKAFESYRRILDEKIDATKIAYASICAYRGRLGEAKTLVVESLVKQQIKSPALLQIRAFLSALEGDAQAAFDDLVQVLDSSGDETQNVFAFYNSSSGSSIEMLAGLAKQTGQIDRFMKFLNGQIEKDPNDWNNYLQGATLLREIGKPGEATAMIDRAADIKTLKEKVYQSRIQQLERLEKNEELIPLYEELIRLTRNKVESADSSSPYSMGFGWGGFQGVRDRSPVETLRERLGELLWQRGDREASVKIWMTGQDPQSAKVHIQMAQRYLKRKAFDLAEESYQQAIRLEPEKTEAHQALLQLKFHRGEFLNALTHLPVVFRESYQSLGTNRYDPSYSWYGNGEYGNSGFSLDPSAVRRLALQFYSADDSHSVDSVNADLAPEDAADLKLMLSYLTGDRRITQEELQARMKTSSYEPMLWTLWAKSLERRGDWNNALLSRQQLERINDSQLRSHRKKLKLLLAGRQIKGATGGMTGSGSTGSSPSSQIASTMTSSFFGSRYQSYRGEDQTSQQITALQLKLKQFDAVERSYLQDREQFVGTGLPKLVKLMQKQGKTERAAELVKLAIGLSDDVSQLTNLVGSLGEAGQVDLAIDMLVRIHRLTGTRDSEGGRYAMYARMRGFGTMSFDWDGMDSETNRDVSAIYNLSVTHGKYGLLIKNLSSEYQQNPGDVRLASLLADLHAAGKNEQAARDIIAALVKSRPKETPLKSRLFRMHVNLEDWPAAAALAQELGKTDSATWKLREALVRIFQGDTDTALKLLETEEALKDSLQAGRDALLMAVGKYDRLIELLETRRKTGMQIEESIEPLFKLYSLRKKWTAAARLALEEIWKSSSRIDEDEWFNRLRHLVRMAKESNQKLEVADERPEDKALLELLSSGHEAGQKAFQNILDQHPEHLNARRGLILASMLANDTILAAKINRQLTEWLKPRRFDVWHSANVLTFQQRVEAFKKLTNYGLEETSELLDISSSVSQMLQQLFSSSSDYGNSEAVRYDVLWSMHRKLERELLLLNSQPEQFRKLVHSQRHSLTGYDSSAINFNNMGGGFNYWMRSQRQSASRQDWRDVVKDAFHRYGELEPLENLMGELGSRLPESDWLLMSEICAALGRSEESEHWKRLWVENRIASLRSSDGPKLQVDSDGPDYSRHEEQWRKDLGILEQGPPASDENDDSLTTNFYPGRYFSRRYQSWYSGNQSSLADLALTDPEVESRLLELEADILPGWEDTESFSELTNFYSKKKKPQKVIELLERVYENDHIFKSDDLPRYIRACYAAKDYARVERILVVIEKRSPKIHQHVDLVKLMLLRHQKKNEEANRLEKQLVAASRRRLKPRWLPDPKLAEFIDDGASMRYAMMSMSMFPDAYRYSSSLSVRSDSYDPSVALAAAVGIQVDSKMKDEDFTLTHIRSSYYRHGFYEHALKILNLEQEQLTQNYPEAERMQLLSTKADMLFKTGRIGDSEKLYAQVEEFHLQLSKNSATDLSEFLRRPLHISEKASRPELEKALQSHRKWRQMSPEFDQYGVREAYYLFRLGRYNEAWVLYDGAIRKGGFSNVFNTGTLYRAGISAIRSGQQDRGIMFLRQALWRNPSHILASQAEELIKK